MSRCNKMSQQLLSKIRVGQLGRRLLGTLTLVSGLNGPCWLMRFQLQNQQRSHTAKCVGNPELHIQFETRVCNSFGRAERSPETKRGM